MDITQKQTIRIDGDFINLDSLLKFAGLVQTGGEAKFAIKDGEAKVNGTVETRRSKKLVPGDIVVFRGAELVLEKD